MVFHERLIPVEMKIADQINKLGIRYEQLIENAIKNPITITSKATEQEVKYAVSSGRTLKYSIRDRDADLIHYFNPRLNAIIIEYGNQVRTMFTLKDFGWYSKGGKRFYNKILGEIMMKK